MKISPTPKINIVFLTDCLADLAGGAEKQIYELAKRLDKDRFNVIVVSLDCYGNASSELMESAGAQLFIFRVKRIYGLSGLLQGLKFRSFLKEKKIDILQTYHFSSDMWGTFWAHLAGVPVVISNRRDMGFWRGRHHVWAYRFFNRWVNKIVVVSDSIKKMVMMTEGVTENKIEVIYNGIDFKKSEFSPTIKRELGLKDNELVIMHVANLKPIKGHLFLLETAAATAKVFPNFKIVLIGKDEFNGQLQKQAQELGISDKIVFLGKREDVSRLLPAADICVLPSLSEGMSNAVLEYMLAGKPVVATKVGGNPELIRDGFNGFLVEPKNAEQLKEALLKLLKDPSQRNLMGQNALRIVREQFSMDTMVSRYERLFKSYSEPSARKLLHLISSGGLFGAENVMLNLASHINGITSYVGALNNRHNPHLEIVTKAQQMGVKTIIFDSHGRFDLGAVLRVRKFLLENNIDIIHTHNYKSDIVGFLAAKLTGKKWVATNHVWHSTDQKLKFYETIDAFVLKHAQKVIAVSEEIRKDLISRNFRDSHVKTIHNGINIEEFSRQDKAAIQQLKNELGVKEDELVILIVGRLSKEKGHAVFVEAAAQVLQQKVKIKFFIVGNGPLMESLRAEVARHNLADQIIFTGIRKDMPQVYSITDVLVNASSIEGLPMTILEAMAAQVAIIATKVGAVPQVIIDQKNGILLEVGDVNGLVKAISYLIDYQDVRIALAQQGYRDVCAKFSVVTMSEKYREVYQEILN